MKNKVKSDERLFLVLSALGSAHRIIEAGIEGKLVTANMLENYYGAMNELLNTTGNSGCLIASSLEEIIDAL